jgi:small subunit ribosomal protein S9
MAKKTSKLKYYEAVGRRKSAIAKVRFYIITKEKEINVSGTKIKKGEIYINKKKIEDYFPRKVEENKYIIPFKLTDSLNRFAVSIHVKGGGKNGQLEAILLGISRALVLVNKDFRPVLKKNGLLTRDARVRERRKVGTGGKARRKKQSPKR